MGKHQDFPKGFQGMAYPCQNPIFHNNQELRLVIYQDLAFHIASVEGKFQHRLLNRCYLSI
jgi:hypothetical protein